MFCITYPAIFYKLCHTVLTAVVLEFFSMRSINVTVAETWMSICWDSRHAKCTRLIVWYLKFATLIKTTLSVPVFSRWQVSERFCQSFISSSSQPPCLSSLFSFFLPSFYLLSAPLMSWSLRNTHWLCTYD